ncbi:S-adenosyl-L-methionine-dependent methyltransferase [Xylariales sp. PMI_506]|nr:S-adenosyl-L-methionine-dependent methyltransferase [Xylariales sp. PMI_506]
MVSEEVKRDTETPHGGRWCVPLPVLPSEISESYEATQAPKWIFAEVTPPPLHQQQQTVQTTTPALDSFSYPPRSTIPQYNENPSFTDTANRLIDEILNRTPSGGSVVDPDSVIGESLRLYHGYKDGKYYLPNDAAEQDRLDLQHEMTRLLFDGWLSLVPFPSVPKYVLDIGTGTGIWAFEFAEQNPSSYVIGADLSAIQPMRDIKNCQFIKTDIEDEWVFTQPNPSHENCIQTGCCETHHKITFDYIHLRFMFSCFDDARTVMTKAFHNLASGGWIEFQETIPDIYQNNPRFPGVAMQTWASRGKQGAAMVGRDVFCVLNYTRWLEEIGFVDVTMRKFLLPCGEWPQNPKLKLVGRYFLQDLLEGIRPAGYKLLRVAGMKPEEIESLVDQCALELRDPQNQMYWYCYVIVGRKP